MNNNVKALCKTDQGGSREESKSKGMAEMEKIDHVRAWKEKECESRKGKEVHDV